MTRRSLHKSIVVLMAAGLVGGGLSWQPAARATAAVPAYQQMALLEEGSAAPSPEFRTTAASSTERSFGYRGYGYRGYGYGGYSYRGYGYRPSYGGNSNPRGIRVPTYRQVYPTTHAKQYETDLDPAFAIAALGEPTP